MLPQGEKLRKAIRWISEFLEQDTTADLNGLVFTAISKFDLNPKESEELIQFYRRSQHTLHHNDHTS